MKILKFSLSACYVPCKELIDANALSRTPCSLSSEVYMVVEVEVTAHVNTKMVICFAFDHLIVIIVKDTNGYKILLYVCSYIQEGRLNSKNQCSHTAAPFWQHRSNLTVLKGLLMMDDRIVTQKSYKLRFWNS